MAEFVLFPVTSRCNLKCKFCAAVKSEVERINIPLSLSCLDKLKGTEVDWVYVTGGEPFLVDNLMSILDDIRAKGFKVGITTNGTISRPDIVDHADRVGISLDGDKEYHDNYRGAGVFELATDFFTNYLKGKTETVITTVRYQDNHDAIERLRPVVEAMDPDYWQIQEDYYANHRNKRV